jgi:hypothetical protein
MRTDYLHGLNRRTVEAFFQDYSEAGLRAQVQWCKRNLDLSDQYFARMLCIEQNQFKQWQHADATLAKSKQEVLRAFWRLYLHLRTFYNADMCAVRDMYNHHVPKSSDPERRTAPPWSGTSIKAYIEAEGGSGINTVQAWMDALRIPRAL